jgi:hypothetical protein
VQVDQRLLGLKTELTIDALSLVATQVHVEHELVLELVVAVRDGRAVIVAGVLLP